MLIGQWMSSNASVVSYRIEQSLLQAREVKQGHFPMNSFIRRMYHTLQQLLTTATQNTATNINFSFIKQPFIFTASCIVLYIIECFTAKPQFLESIKRPDPAIVTQMRDLPC